MLLARISICTEERGREASRWDGLEGLEEVGRWYQGDTGGTRLESLVGEEPTEAGRAECESSE